MTYRTRLAPTPSGLLHLGHAATFYVAQQRTLAHKGELLYRLEDIDRERSREHFAHACEADLTWLGFKWALPIIVQSHRHALYKSAWQRLSQAGVIYPSPHSRRDIQAASEGTGLFPTSLRQIAPLPAHEPGDVNWRFRVPDGRVISFTDERLGEHHYQCGKDIGDFIIWRKDGWPAYELAVVVDDADASISEVVRGEDLLQSTARQLLLYEALGLTPPRWFHCPLIQDPTGDKLSKSTGSRSLQSHREKGESPDTVLGLAMTHLKKNGITLPNTMRL